MNEVSEKISATLAPFIDYCRENDYHFEPVESTDSLAFRVINTNQEFVTVSINLIKGDDTQDEFGRKQLNVLFHISSDDSSISKEEFQSITEAFQSLTGVVLSKPN